MEQPGQIKTLRYRLGLSQRELADRAHLDVSTLSELENGRVTNPRAPTLYAIAQALGVPVDDLFVPSDSGSRPEESFHDSAASRPTAPASEASEATVAGTPLTDGTADEAAVGNR